LACGFDIREQRERQRDRDRECSERAERHLGVRLGDLAVVLLDLLLLHLNEQTNGGVLAQTVYY
jgi:hypothetical protein